MKNIVLGVLFIFLITSCATHHGTISSSALDENCVYQETALGVSKTGKILGIGGLSKDALIYEAKKELNKNFSLEPGESYINYTLDIKRSFYLVFSQTEVTLTSDIIKRVGDSTVNPFSDKYLSNIGQIDQPRLGLFEVGDAIYFDLKKEGIIVSFPKPNKAKVQYSTPKGNIKIKNVSVRKLYSKKGEMNSYKIGDYYGFKTEINDKKATKVGKVIGIGHNSLLLENQEANIRKVVKLN
ncbi:MAG: DUF6567 family protein [Bacteroidales bacterium]